MKVALGFAGGFGVWNFAWFGLGHICAPVLSVDTIAAADFGILF